LCQIAVSWPFRPEFFGEKDPIEFPTDNAQRVALMKQLTANWAEPFRSLVHDMPDDSEVVAINMEDWAPEQGAHGRGRIVLVGDSAHSMTMCKFRIIHLHPISGRPSPQANYYLPFPTVRGEGANNAIVDVHDFVKRLGAHLPKLDPADASVEEPTLNRCNSNGEFGPLRTAIEAYEDDVNARGIPGVIASRQACLDAHEYARINEKSPLVARRVLATN
jgi:hypothetical protein